VLCPFGAICTPERAYYILGPLLAVGLLLLLAALYTFRKNKSAKPETQKQLLLANSTRQREQNEESERLLSDQDHGSVGFEISLSGVSVQVGRKIPLLPSSSTRTVLSEVTGVFPKAQLIAVMGPSGSGAYAPFSDCFSLLFSLPTYFVVPGKTTMLNVLRGSLPLSSGTVEVNGMRCKRGLKEFKGVTGMVPQDDDTVDPLFTVEEALLHSARLRLPREVTDEERKAEVDRTLTALSLQEVRERFVGTGSTGSSERGVSGGQRKRVNIGVEMVAKPSILLLDEPTR
jgi:ABC-type cobalamin/Fe3+-siderophores transport system ATPase subunit